MAADVVVVSNPFVSTRLRALVLVGTLASLTSGCTQKPVGVCGKDATIVPARGCGEFALGRTKRAEILPDRAAEGRFGKSGLFFEFDSRDHLAALVVSSRQFVDDAGIRVGDAESSVVAKRGQPNVGDWKMLKGNATVGSIGEHVLIYPGLEYGINDDKVWIIRVMQE